MRLAGWGSENRARTATRGFTLVEVLATIAVLVVLAALLLPVLAQTRKRARRATCLSHLRQIVQAHQMYVQDWAERLPGWSQTGPRASDRPIYWTEYLAPYLRSAAILRDSSAPEKGFEGATLADYALLTWGPAGRWSLEEPHFRWPGPPLRLADVPRLTETIQFAEGWTTTSGSAIDGWEPAGGRTQRRLRHGEGLNAGFLDGHARWLPEEVFWRATTNGRGLYWLQYATADR